LSIKGWTIQEVKSYGIELYEAIETLRDMESKSTHFTAAAKLEQVLSEQLASLADITSKVDQLINEWQEFQKNIEQQIQDASSKQRD
jgi:hypothetical protein